MYLCIFCVDFGIAATIFVSFAFFFSVKKASVSNFTLRNSPSIKENNNIISQAAVFGVKSIEQFFVVIKLENNNYFYDLNLKKLDWRATPINVLKTSKIIWCVS